MSKKVWQKGEEAWLASAYGAPKKVTLASGGAAQPRVTEGAYGSRQVNVADLHETEDEAVRASARMMVERLQRQQRQRETLIEANERHNASLRRDIEAEKHDIAAAIARARELGVVFASTGGSQEVKP